MRCDQIKHLLSDLYERFLADHEADLLTAHLAECEHCRAELAELEEVLKVIHSLPRQEPVLDLWQEFAPKMAEIRAEMRLGPVGRFKLRLAHFWETLIEGATMFATVVSYNVSRRFQRSFSMEEAE